LINSPKVATYDLKPEMSAYEVTDKVLECINKKEYDVIILNYANPDMVGIPECLRRQRLQLKPLTNVWARLFPQCLSKRSGIDNRGSRKFRADDRYETGGPFTAHTTNPVPLIVIGLGDVKLREGRLADLAPTMLDILGFEKPKEMTGESLIVCIYKQLCGPQCSDGKRSHAS